MTKKTNLGGVLPGPNDLLRVSRTRGSRRYNPARLPSNPGEVDILLSTPEEWARPSTMQWRKDYDDMSLKSHSAYKDTTLAPRHSVDLNIDTGSSDVAKAMQ